MSVVLRASLLHFFRLVCYRQEVCKNSQCLKITKKSLLFQYCERFSFQVGTPIPTIFIGENQFLVSFNLKSGGIRVPTLKLENETFLNDFQILWLRGWIIHFLIVVLQVFLDCRHVFNIFWTFELTAWLTRVSVTLYTGLISSAIEQQFCIITFIRQNDVFTTTTILIQRATKHLVNQTWGFFFSSHSECCVCVYPSCY